ncbi:Invasion associated locus B family protein [Rhizobium sp. PDO1-076]|uniref:invasion associated locus B family protein n=1 Tax=Rhizobium sp. PDO1-076 TaxID=1125979 RepID=UPI00024E328D|nr:invasion associated locus B family protein [Rhizobium sp. PDO1-076]EHS50902.1 Invasion associated locus B family protein [Rhizobium sp. PDO1-076]
MIQFRSFRYQATLLALMFAAEMPCTALAQDVAPPLASSLTETYDNWVVDCRRVNGTDPAMHSCAMSQSQVNAKRQRVLAIEVQPRSDGASAIMVLPFGLALSQGITVQVDATEKSKPIPFTTCLPTGCVASLDMDPALLKALRQSEAFNVGVQSNEGQPLEFSVSLAGFSAAFERTNALNSEHQ